MFSKRLDGVVGHVLMNRLIRFVSRSVLPIVSIILSDISSAGPLTCIRQSAMKDVDPCALGIARYAYVLDQREPERRVCTMIYDDSNCKNAPAEFDHVFGADGAIVCTVNYHQPPISMACATDPDHYTWVPHAWPEG